MKKSYITWKEIDELTDLLSHQILESGIQFENVFGMPRGGLIPAVMISHKLQIPLTTKSILPTTLIIDDICDTGNTFMEFQKQLNYIHEYASELKFACLHYKPHTSVVCPAFYANSWNLDDWIVYPWERSDSDTIQDYKNCYYAPV